LLYPINLLSKLIFQNGKSNSTKNPEKKVIKIERELLYCCQFCSFSSAFKCGWVQHQKKHSARLEKGGSPTDNDTKREQQTKRPIRKVLLKLHETFPYILFSQVLNPLGCSFQGI